jgi:hypothetical protein
MTYPATACSPPGAQDDIMPAWEDTSNKDGGKWSVQLPKEKNRARIDEMWLYTVRPHSLVPKSEPYKSIY